MDSQTRVPRVGVGVVIHREGRVLLMHRSNVLGAGSWSTPGGHLDFGESFEACAVRETLEETGVHVVDVRFLAITNDCFEAERKHYVTVWMEARHHSGEASVCAEHEMSEVGWFAWDDLPSPLFAPFGSLLAGRGFPAASWEFDAGEAGTRPDR